MQKWYISNVCMYLIVITHMLWIAPYAIPCVLRALGSTALAGHCSKALEDLEVITSYKHCLQGYN